MLADGAHIEECCPLNGEYAPTVGHLYRGGGLDVIRKKAWPSYRTSSGALLCWELEEPKGPKGLERNVPPPPGSDAHAK